MCAPAHSANTTPRNSWNNDWTAQRAVGHQAAALGMIRTPHLKSTDHQLFHHQRHADIREFRDNQQDQSAEYAPAVMPDMRQQRRSVPRTVGEAFAGVSFRHSRQMGEDGACKRPRDRRIIGGPPRQETASCVMQPYRTRICLFSGAALAQTTAASGPARPKAPHGAKVLIVSPKNGAHVGSGTYW